MKRLNLNILRVVLIFCLFMVGVKSNFAFEGQWRLHPTFDDNIERVIETPERVYVHALAQPYEEGIPESPVPMGFLYVYDKEGDEFSVYNASNYLTQSLITQIEYNSVRKYLLIIYDDFNIDILHDNGHTVNIPALKSANIPSSKKINSVSFDPVRKHIYLATDFGFVIINDEKGEIYESRIYNLPLRSIGRMEDRLVAANKDGRLYWAPATAPNFDFTDFSPVTFQNTTPPESVRRIFKLSDSVLGLISDLPEGSEYPSLFSVIKLSKKEGDENEGSDELPSHNDVGSFKDYIVSYEPVEELDFKNLGMGNSGTYRIYRDLSFGIVKGDGTYIPMPIPPAARKTSIAHYNGDELWNAQGRLGLRSINRVTGEITRDFMIPDSPSVFISQDMAYHPTYGLLVSNRGNLSYFPSSNYFSPILLSGLKEGRWEKYGLPYTNNARWMMMLNPSGLAIDPKNSDHVYFGSLISGIGRINLKDPTDILHMGSSIDVAANYPEFIEMLPVSKKWARMARMAPPKFDNGGNLWSLFTNLDNEYQTEVWVWPRANIDATKDPKSFKPWIKLSLDTKGQSMASRILPLTSSGNTTRVLVSIADYGDGLIMLDHKGTLANPGDDSRYSADKLYDQDGQPVGYNYLRYLYEDPTTGLVWIGTDAGVFTVNPSTFPQNPSLVNRIKVSRDDGTSLADYLLNGVDVSTILDDGHGRKWFGTIGGGLVCTSSDGRQVKGEWTVENSMLPDNNVYGLGWNEPTGSLMVSTGKGLAEFFPAGEGNGEDFDALRVYPNPVRPDYFGWVTIDGLTDGALVKITDAHGGLIRELGRVNGGTIQWDAANLNGKRVPSGVYYILASGGESDSSLARIGKILVVN